MAPSDRTVFGRVAFVGTRRFQVAEVEGPLRYWSKVGLYVRAGRTPVSLVAPQAWRKRVAITWGDGGVARVLRVAGCPSPRNVWNGYAGGFYVRTPGCTPLIVRIENHSTVLRFGIGRRCATGASA